MTAGWPESNFYEIHLKKGHSLPLPSERKISMTSTLNLVIHLSPLPTPPLKTWVYKSLIPSNHVKIVPWEKTKQQKVSKKAVAWLKVLEEMLFFDISSHSTFCGKKHCLLVMDDSSDYVWSFFLKEKSNLEDIMLSLMKI